MTKDRRVVITGIGTLSSLGKGKEETWENVLSKKVNIKKLNNPISSKYSGVFSVHKIDNFDIAEFSLDHRVLEDIKKWQHGDKVIDLYYLMAAIQLALDDSKIQYEDRKDVGFVLTHENPGIEPFCSSYIEKTFDIYENNKGLSKEKYFDLVNSSIDNNVSDLQTFMFLFYISKLFDIHGYSLFINNSCASGSYAIETASQTIKNGVNNAVIVASSEHPDIYKHVWLEKLGVLSKQGIIKPFSINRDGFLCGEGGCALVMEDLEHAQKRGATIYAEYLGGACGMESWKITVPDIKKGSYKKTIEGALTKCNIMPSDIDIINAHGLGSTLLDQYEANAMTDIFGDNFKKPYLTAFKPYLGHTLGNSALVETILLLLSMQENVVPPILNFEDDDPKLKLNISRNERHDQLNTALKIVWGFGGYSAATLFRKIT